MPKPLDEAKEGQDEEPGRIKTFFATNLSYKSTIFCHNRVVFCCESSSAIFSSLMLRQSCEMSRQSSIAICFDQCRDRVRNVATY